MREQAERGENLMGAGISEMLGRVDHGSATMPIQSSDTSYDAADDAQVGDGQFDSRWRDYDGHRSVHDQEGEMVAIAAASPS